MSFNCFLWDYFQVNNICKSYDIKKRSRTYQTTKGQAQAWGQFQPCLPRAWWLSCEGPLLTKNPASPWFLLLLLSALGQIIQSGPQAFSGKSTRMFLEKFEDRFPLPRKLLQSWKSVKYNRISSRHDYSRVRYGEFRIKINFKKSRVGLQKSQRPCTNWTWKVFNDLKN